jgi:hypothetical protein
MKRRDRSPPSVQCSSQRTTPTRAHNGAHSNQSHGTTLGLMRKPALALLAAASLAACGSDEPTQAGGPTGKLASLTVTVDRDGAKGGQKPLELKLDCEKPTDSQACGAAAGVSAADLRPTGGDTACTQIYGGPEEAAIKGEIRGESVDATFTRTDGCEISRWDRVKALLAEVQ